MKTLLIVLIGILLLGALAVPLGILLVTPVRSNGSPAPVVEVNIPAAPTTAPTAAPTAQPLPVQPEPTRAAPIPNTGSSPIAVPSASTGVVNADPLNLRLGPGKTYPISRTLNIGQEVRVDGRSSNSQWLVVVLPDGAAGWVMAAYIDTTTNIASLPVKEASGGPLGSGTKPTQAAVVKKYNIYVTISDNIATVNLSRFPADAGIILSLGLPGQGADVKMASAKTNGSGSASISFEMPATWSDGRDITETDLKLIAATTDGSFSRTASIQYYK